jgi:hypothetical protein
MTEVTKCWRTSGELFTRTETITPPRRYGPTNPLQLVAFFDPDSMVGKLRFGEDSPCQSN